MENKKLILVTGSGAESKSIAKAFRATNRYEVTDAPGTINDCYGVFGAAADQQLLNTLYGSGVQHVVLLANQHTQTPGLPASFVRIPFYYEDLLNNYLPQAENKIAAASVEDLGPVVTTMFDHPEMYIGRTVNVIGTDVTAAEYASLAAKVLGVYIPCNGAHVEQSIPNRQVALIESYGLNPRMQTFESWLMRNKAALLEEVFVGQ